MNHRGKKWLLTSYLYFSPAFALFSLSRASCRPFFDFFSLRDREATKLLECDIAEKKPNLFETLQNCQPSSSSKTKQQFLASSNIQVQCYTKYAVPVALRKFSAEVTVIFFPLGEKFQIQLISPGDIKGDQPSP